MVERRFEFQHFGRGFRLVSKITKITDNAPPRLSRMVRASVEPLQGLNIGFIIDASGRLLEVEDAPGVWSEVMAAITRLTDQADSDGLGLPLLQSIATLDDRARRTLLLNEVADLLRYAGRGDVMGENKGGDMVAVTEAVAGDWQLTASVHQFSGLCWQMDKAMVGAASPRHGIAGSSMRLTL